MAEIQNEDSFQRGVEKGYDGEEGGAAEKGGDMGLKAQKSRARRISDWMKLAFTPSSSKTSTEDVQPDGGNDASKGGSVGRRFSLRQSSREQVASEHQSRKSSQEQEVEAGKGRGDSGKVSRKPSFSIFSKFPFSKSRRWDCRLVG